MFFQTPNSLQPPNIEPASFFLLPNELIGIPSRQGNAPSLGIEAEMARDSGAGIFP